MATIRLGHHREMSVILRKEMNVNKEALARALKRVCQRTVTQLKRVSPVGATREYQEGWGVKGFGIGIRIVNTAPYAGIIERGADKHPVSEQGIKSITDWVLAKGLASDDKKAREIAEAIAWKIRHYGQKAQHILEKQIPKILKMLGEVLKDEMRKARRRA